MRVVICGGAKTENIVKATRDNFKSSGVDFLTVKYIDTVADLFNRGEYFDRIILVEPGWTRDGIITSETQIRHTLSEFANQMIDQNTNPKSEYVFLSQTQEMAGIVNEEILLIKSQSELAVKAPPYKVNLFKALVLAELGRFPEQLAYKSTEVISDDRGDNFTEEIPPEPDQFTPEDIIPGSVRNANNLDYNSGMDPNDFDQWLNENGQGAPVEEMQQPDQGQTPNIDWDMSKGGEQPPYNPDMPQDGFDTDFPDDPFGGIPEADWPEEQQPTYNPDVQQDGFSTDFPDDPFGGVPEADWPEDQPVEPPVEQPVEQPISGDDYSQPVDGDPNNWSPQEDWPDVPQEPQQSWENPTDQTFEPQPSEPEFTPPDNIGNIPDYSGPDSGYKGIPTEEIPQDEPVYPGQNPDYNDPSMGMPQESQEDWNNDYGDYGQSQEQPVYPEYNGNQPYIDPPVTVDDDEVIKYYTAAIWSNKETDISFKGRIFRIVSQINLKVTDVEKALVEKMELLTDYYPKQIMLYGSHGKNYPVTACMDEALTSGAEDVLLDTQAFAADDALGTATVNLSSGQSENPVVFLLPFPILRAQF